MKRKRQSREAQRASKRAKIEGTASERPSNALLRQYYNEVVTLRQYLASRLPKKRRRRLRQYGRDASSTHNEAVVRLLDTTVVGSFQHIQIDDSSFVEEDINLFTQQLSEIDSTLHLSPGSFKQSEIVDFVIWVLFRRQSGTQRPQHVLCQNYQRYVTANDNGPGPEIAPGIPGVYSCGPHENVDTLKRPPWSDLPSMLGCGAERYLSDLLIDCGVYMPVAESSNLVQISGVPMSELKVLGRANRPRLEDASARAEGTNGTHSERPNTNRGMNDIRFVRHRMLYSRPSLNAQGYVKVGLNQIHVLNRYHNTHDATETHHVMKYIFPLEFGLHNVFTSNTSPIDSSELFKDYTIREQEIKRQMHKHQRTQHPSADGNATRRVSLPKRLRGEAERLVGRLRKRHQRCTYSALLDHYCPRNDAEDTTETIRRASSTSRVSAFCKAAVLRVFPKDFWGRGASCARNLRMVLRSIERFVRLRRYETISVHDVLQGIKLDEVEWMKPVKINIADGMSASDYTKRKGLMAELLYYLFDSFLIPLVRGHFHVTESNVQRNQLFYFRHDVWKEMSEPALCSLKQSMMEPCSTAEVNRKLATRALGVSHVRLLPKETGMRPIINLRRRVQKMQHGKMVLGRSINSILTPTFSVLNYEKATRPDMLGSALFSVDDIFPRLQTYRQSLAKRGLLGKPLYFAKVDVQACFDTIPQKRLMALARKIIVGRQYQISRYSRAKLLGSHNKETPGFGAKPSWKFLTKATSSNDSFDFQKETENDTSDGRTRSVYINGLAPKREDRQAILSLLEEHVEANLIKVGKRFYRQKEGIPQGSILSSLLCSFFYAELERETLAFIDDGKSVLLRLIDDFLVISTERIVAQKFMRHVHAGIPEFGVQIKAEKSRTNFDIELDGVAITKVEGNSFPYCGHTIDTGTLDLSKDWERRRKSNIADSVTVEYSKLPGQTFYRKALNALKLQMHAMLLSTGYNSRSTVLSNLYRSFDEVAQKTYHYMRSLPSANQPTDGLTIRAVDDLTKLACVLMRRRKRTSKDVIAYECSVSDAETRW